MQKILIFSTLCIYFSSSLMYAQELYIAGNGPGGIVLGSYDVSTCTFCPEFEIPFSLFQGGTGDLVPLPNGQVVMTGQDIIYVFDPPNPVPISTLNPPGNIFYLGGVLAPNGNVYLSGADIVGGSSVSSLYEYNPTTNTLFLVGTFPPNTIIMDEIFYWNGVLHAFITDISNMPPTFGLATIQIGNPLTANILYSYSNSCFGSTATISSGPNAGIYTGVLDPNCTGSDLFSFDLPNNSTTFECEINPSGFPYGMGEIPAGFPASNCLCLTNAGTILAQPPAIFCTNVSATITHNNNAILDANDVLQYVLFSNPSDTAGSIIAISNIPNFTFAPPMQTGVTYYLSAVAGNNTGGNVDLSDPCLDFSNATQIVWQPTPTVTLTTANPNFCEGSCKTVNLSFTGTPPFNLTYSTPLATMTQTFTASTGTLQICAPTGTNMGIFNVTAIMLMDANCTCP